MKFLNILNLKIFIIFNLISLFGFQKSLNANSEIKQLKKPNFVGTDYLKSKGELEDYIIDSGDIIWIEFNNNQGFSGAYNVNNEGEIFLPRLNNTFIRGLTKNKLADLLNEAYSNYLLNPEINISLIGYREIKVKIEGEVKTPGIYRFSFSTNSPITFFPNQLKDDPNMTSSEILGSEINSLNTNTRKSNIQKNSLQMDILNNSREGITTLSKVIRQAGGPTTFSDLSNIEVIRNISMDKGGGKKRAIINLLPFINGNDYDNDIRIFDGDIIKITKSKVQNDLILSKSILSGLSPKFINASVFGRVKKPGQVTLPLEATLSDALDLSGPILPLSGKIMIIRYLQDGKLSKKFVNYRTSARRGSKNNPYLKAGDLISVKDSFIGRSTDILNEITLPLIGIYTTKELIEDF